ncbi:hypothetical protein FSP39_016827 [Pinctada imbricata]|uniref:Afadin n=1 Tax=Pinctada imbricata TaxID=66713 RepID=A0AA88Y5C3_PINIB|nr:hypothetical protein FSP39_016827 [Pinctada imbricata]
MDPQEKAKERQRLAQLVRDWNQEHYDIFELSQPNENLEFHGVVRFYFQDGANVVTKCIRVASSATTQEVVDVLVEKFRPDMRMLTANKYALYEVHANGDERRLQDAEKVLYVQLNWGSDVREGRFLLKKEGVPTISPHADKENQNFKRKLSKREKKEKKKLEKEQKKNEAAGVAEKLYTEMPETRFTRSISNPEAVMKRRRQQKVEKKLQQCRGQDGQGGTLKIYGETIRPDVPYKTLLLSTADTVNYVIKETMEKYGLEKEDPDDYCLYKVLVPPGEREYHGGVIGEERIMEEYECPLAIAMDYPPSKDHRIRRRKPRGRGLFPMMICVTIETSKPRKQNHQYLEELNPDGSENPKGKLYHLKLKYTEVGSDPSMPIRIQGPSIMPRHCVISLTQNDGIVMVMPASPDAEMYVNNMRIFETTTLQNGMVVRFGKINFFRFLDPNYEEKLRRGQIPPDGAQQKRNMPQQMQGKQPLETDLDADVPMNGHVPHHAARPQEPMEVQQSRPGHQQMSPRREERGPPPPQQRQIEDLLPAALEFRDDKETDFFAAVILDGSNAGVQFKLAPTYVIYMAVRYCITGGYRSDLGPQEKAIATSHLVSKIADFVTRAIHESRDNPAALAFWMANSSEILHFYKQDNDVQPFSQDAQEILAESVQLSFQHLVKCLQYDLQRTMPAFLEDHDDEDMNGDRRMQYNRRGPILEDVLDTLSSAMNLLRRCRVNAALTIQLFSQLFHFINMWLFNILVREPNHQLCTRLWGQRLKRRLGSIEAWAEKQGLELAADCHLCRISQAAHLLQAAKSSPDDITNITSTCFKLNSYQVRELLVKYISEPDEPPIPQSLIEGVVKIAENMADAQIKNDGREICLEEDADLQLPFLLPEDGYSCDTIKGIPKGLDEFIEPLARAGLCRLTPQPGSSGSWTIYMNGDEGAKIDEAVRKGQQQQQQHQQPPVQQHPQPGQGQGPEGSRPQPQLPREPEVANVTFSKVKGSMGLSIVAAVPKGEPQKESGIYIKSVVPGGAAALDGRLQAGDQLLEVDGKSLVGLSQERAAELMTRTGQTVTLKVAKQGAFYHGLATLLSQPSPVLPRASPKKPSSPQVGKHRPHEEGPPPYNGNQELDRNRPPQNKQQMMAQSRSSPALNKYRKGISNKDMENIYQGRPALWRLIMEHDLQAFIEKRGPNPDSAPGAFSYQNPRSKSTSAIEELDNVLKDAEDEIRLTGANKENKNVPRAIRKARSARRKTETDIDMRKMQADLRKYKTVCSRSPHERPRLENVVPLRERSKSFSELDRNNARRSPAQHNGNYNIQRHSANVPYNMAVSVPTLSQSKSIENVRDRGHYGQPRARQSWHAQPSQPSIQRSKSLGSFDRYSQNQAEVNQAIHAQILAAQKRKSQSRNQMPTNQKQSRPAFDGYEHNLHGTHPSQFSTNHYNVNNVNNIHSRSKSYDKGSQNSRGQHMRSHSGSAMYSPNDGHYGSGSNDSAFYSDSSHGYVRSSDYNQYSDKISRSSPPSSIGSYTTFREKMHYNLSDSGINLKDFGGSYQLEVAEQRVNSSRLNSTMRDPMDGGSLSSNNSVMFSIGGNHITRNPRNKNITRSRDNMGPGGRAVSMGNIRDQPQHSPHGHRMPPGHHGNMREPDPKSKSIPNLRMDNSFDHREPSHHQQQQHMRPAASVGALQHPNPAFHEYYNQGRPDPRGNDYENHPSMDPRMQRGQPDPRRNERDYQDMSQTLPPGLMGRGQVRHGSDGPPSSRNSGSSFRDDRPQSAYFGQGQMEKPDYRDDRPKSMEVTLDRVQDLHQRFGPPQHSPHQSPHESSFENDRDPNYMNTRAQRQHQMQSGYVNQSDIPKFTAHNEARQPNFYENTSPRQNEPSPAFHQLKRPPFENENKTRPQPMPKPSVAPKPNAPKAIPADIPRVDVDNRQTQSHFFEPHMHQDPRTMQNSDPRMQRVPTSHHQNFIPGQPHLSHSQGMNSLPHQKHSPGREMYVQPTHQSPELPPPPQEIPPELPPPPAPEDLPEELPPLPPPPVNDYRLDSMDPQYANQADPRSFGSQPGYPHHQLNQPQQRGQPHVQDNRFGNRENPDRQRIMGYAEPQRQQPQLSMAASVPRGFQPNNDYQNISYERQNKVFNAPSQHSPGQNVYESYDPKSGKPQGMDIQQSKHRLMAEVNDFAKSKKDGVSPLTSPWDREEMEKSQKVREEEMNRLRELEIQDLESRPYLAPQEQDRLRKLRLEQEFQRRVQEVSGRDEDEEDSDTDITNRSQVGREFLMQTIQEDIVKAQRRLEDLNHKQQYEEYQQEKERMLRLERKLEIFEQEREERQNRLQKRQEKKQKEQEDYQRKQRELREKQRQEYEDQKRAMQLEEEKVKRRQQEEERRRKEFEKERLREIEAQKEREEAAARAEIRRREEEFQRQQMEQRERERREQEREIRVNEERKRLDAMSQGYQPYANLPATQSQYGAPPPPQRGSSYDITNNTSMGRSAPNFGRNDLHQNNMNSMNNGFRNGGPNANSSMKMQENSVFVPKKSVSFNTQLETRNTYSVGSESRGSQSSYRTNSVSSDQNEASSPNVHNSFPQTNNVNDSVFTSTNSTPQQNHVQYRTSEGTPNVVGAQEVYRDPRNRIQAQREAQDKNVIKKSGNADRMSFRDKMKFFAQEAGEGTPKDKSRVSKTLRDIESQLHNGQ